MRWTLTLGQRVRGQAKTGTLVLLGVLVVAIAGIWFWQLRSGGVEKTAIVDTGSRIGWCPACKKDFKLSSQEAGAIAKQGDKLQCPLCKKFEANWGGPPDGTSPTGVMLP